MADAVTATKKKYMNFKEIAAYSLGLFGFQAIVGLLNSRPSLTAPFWAPMCLWWPF